MHREELIVLGVLFALVFTWVLVANQVMPRPDSTRPGADFGSLESPSKQLGLCKSVGTASSNGIIRMLRKFGCDITSYRIPYFARLILNPVS